MHGTKPGRSAARDSRIPRSLADWFAQKTEIIGVQNLEASSNWRRESLVALGRPAAGLNAYRLHLEDRKTLSRRR
jgi:hypothetical protein